MDAYYRQIAPGEYPLAILMIDAKPSFVDVNVHPAKTEVRFRQQSLVHDFVRDSLRTALIKARPAAGFLAALDSAPAASPSLMPASISPLPGAPESGPQPPDSDPAAFEGARADAESFQLTPRLPSAFPGKLPFVSSEVQTGVWKDREAWGEAAAALFQPASLPPAGDCSDGPGNGAGRG